MKTPYRKTYYIYRFYFDINKRPRFIMSIEGLDKTQEYCKREDTHKLGEWFDGYSEHIIK